MGSNLTYLEKTFCSKFFKKKNISSKKLRHYAVEEMSVETNTKTLIVTSNQAEPNLLEGSPAPSQHELGCLDGKSFFFYYFFLFF